METAHHDLVTLASPAAWRASLEGLRHGFAHTWESSQAMNLTTRASTYLYRVRTESGRAVCPLSERKWGGCTDLVTPFGFSGFAGTGIADPLRHLAEFATARGYVCAYLLPNPCLEETIDDRVEEGARHVFVVDLRRSEAELFSRLSQNRKREVRAFESDAGPVVRDRSKLKEFVLSRYPDFMRKKGAAPVYELSEETLDALLDFDSVLAVGAGAPHVDAVSVFGYTAHAADYLFNISIGPGRQRSTGLIWTALRDLKARGVASLNLGGGIREGDGVAAYKARFGAHKMSFAGIKQIYRPAVFADLCRRAGADPSSSTGYFPPYWDPRRVGSSHLSVARCS